MRLRLCAYALFGVALLIAASTYADPGVTTRVHDPRKHASAGGSSYAFRQKVVVVLKELDLKPGDTVVDIGAGDGWWSLRMADAVGPTGTIYAAEVEQKLVDRLKAQCAGKPQVKPYLCKPDSTELPAGSCDLAFFSYVYHHLPRDGGVDYLQRLRKVIKPSGRMVVIEKYSAIATKNKDHGTDLSKVLEEAESAGWIPVRCELLSGTETYMAIFVQKGLFRPAEAESQAKPIPTLPLVVPLAADQFIEFIGVGTFLGGPGAPFPEYANHAQVLADLQNLGVRHIRDPLWGAPPAYETFNRLASLGIHTSVSVGYMAPGAAVDAFIARLRNMADAVESVEGVNEPDHHGFYPPSGLTAQQVFDMQRDLYTKVKADAVLGTVGKQIPVLAPPIAGAAPDAMAGTLHDRYHIENYVDYANAHTYGRAGRDPNNPDPVEQSLQRGLSRASIVAPSKPLIVSETNTSANKDIPDPYEGIYVPRLLLHLYQRGSKRTYYFSLVDVVGDEFGGLYDGKHNLRPEGRAVKNLIATLHDMRDVGKPAFRAMPLNFTLSGDTNSLRSQLFQKRNGDYYLALWREYRASDEATSNVTLALGDQFLLKAVTMYTDLDSASFNADGTPLTFPGNVAAVPVGARVVIVRVSIAAG